MRVNSPGLPAAQPTTWRGHVIALLGIVLLVLLAYGNAWRGAFVYDDRHQILENRNIQVPANYGHALLSDVWSYKGERREAWSNYWRPVFVGWMIVHWRAFGNDPRGWHLTNIALHLAACVLAYFLALRLGASWGVAGAASWIFAAHPAHVESVTWIAGSPDLILACALFGAMICHVRWRSGGGPGWRIAACALYLVGQLTKEAAIIFPVLVFSTDWILDRDSTPRPALAATARRAVPYLVLAVLFLVVRWMVLGTSRITPQNAASLEQAATTLPSVLAFYARRFFWPTQYSPLYELHAFGPESAGLMNFVLPVVGCTAGLWVLWRFARLARLPALALLWLVLPLLLPLDIRSFLPEHIVHDRYLYLPLFGGALALAAAMEIALGRVARSPSAVLPAVLGLVALTLAIQSRRTNPVYDDEIALWTRATTVAPGAADAWVELGGALKAAKRDAEAAAAFSRAAALHPERVVLRINMGLLAAKEGRTADAEREFLQVLQQFPDQPVAVENLGQLYQKAGRTDDAVRVFRDGIKAMPYKELTYSMNIAVTFKLADRDAEALAALEQALPALENATSLDEADAAAWFYLGELRLGAGRKADATSAYRRFLATTSTARTPHTQQLRSQAEARLDQRGRDMVSP